MSTKPNGLKQNQPIDHFFKVKNIF